MLQKFKEKKKRSKSCINKSDNIFTAKQNAIELKKEKTRDKSNEANKTTILSGNLVESKRHPARDKNCMIELRELKKQVDREIAKEQREGKLGLTRLEETSKERSKSQGKSATRKPLQSKAASGASTTKALNYTSLRLKPNEENFDDLRHLDDGAFKAKGSYSSTNVNTSKIQKFIEKQKKRNDAKNKKEKTIEYEKYLKVR